MSDHGRPNSIKLDMLDDVYEGNPYGTTGSHALEIPDLVLSDSPEPPRSRQTTRRPTRQTKRRPGD